MPNQANTPFRFKPDAWEPIVAFEGDDLIYCVPVASGHVDKEFRFQISHSAFEVLKADVERRYFLYAVLHQQFQMKPMSRALQVDPSIDLILFGAVEAVETHLSRQDAESNGTVSNLVRICMGRDQAPMLAGRWFET